MLRLIDLAAARGVRTLYKNASLTASPGERVGLTGANGSGKSTLFALLLGELAAEAGRIEAPPASRIAHVAQDIEASGEAALDYVLAGHAPLIAARAELRSAEAADDNLRLSNAHAHLAELNEGALAAQAASVLGGLGFAQSDLRRPVSEFSGGWRNRLALARALMRPADLLLLDEPTNHLDLDSVIWLEAWLRRQPATVLLISHDREFLDRCTTTTWHIADGGIRRYAGNYSAFELAWAEQQRQQDAAARAYARTAAHLQSFVDRFRAQATKARQAQSRIKMLERLVAVEPARAGRDWRFEFPEPRRLPERLLDAEDLRLAYGPRTILDEVKFLIRSGDRIGVLGVNGAGKSTLVRSIAGELAPAAGELRRGNGLAIGYFAQHQLDQLRPEESPLQHLRRLAEASDPQAREQDLRNFLGQFRFGAEMASSPVGPMSGGEKARCALALLAWSRPNLLLLDEPTNHLDMETREALTMALSSFGGALLLVSHDRHLLRAATDQLWLVHDGRVAPFDGDLDEYAALVLASRKVARDGEPRPGATDAANRRDERREAARERQRLADARRPLQRRIDRLEEEIARVAAELRELDARLAAPDFYNAAGEAVAEALRARGTLASRLEQLESRWLALHGELEAIS
jgi:ATP-binding cassette subfamily F protein 3